MTDRGPKKYYIYNVLIKLTVSFNFNVFGKKLTSREPLYSPCLGQGPTDVASGSAALSPHTPEPALLPTEEGGEKHCVE